MDLVSLLYLLHCMISAPSLEKEMIKVQSTILRHYALQFVAKKQEQLKVCFLMPFMVLAEVENLRMSPRADGPRSI